MEKSSSNGYRNNSLHLIAGNMVIPVTVVIIIVFILRRVVITVLLAGIAVAIAVVVFMIVLVLVAGLVVKHSVTRPFRHVRRAVRVWPAFKVCCLTAAAPPPCFSRTLQIVQCR